MKEGERGERGWREKGRENERGAGRHKKEKKNASLIKRGSEL
jgi:hypothetical protein